MITANTCGVLNICQDTIFSIFLYIKSLNPMKQPYEVGDSIIPVLQVRKLRHRKFKFLAQASSKDPRLESRQFDSETVLITALLYCLSLCRYTQEIHAWLKILVTTSYTHADTHTSPSPPNKTILNEHGAFVVRWVWSTASAESIELNIVRYSLRINED